MKKLLSPLAFLTLLCGCAAPFRLPADLRDVELARVNSPGVLVEKVWIERSPDGLFVTGYVGRRFGGSQTSQTHLHFTFTDASGRVLKSSADEFSPNPIPNVARRFDHGTFRMSLDPLPDGTARIEVRAHEGREPCTG